MLTRGIIKSIMLLKDKKYRTERGLFVVEGEKSVLELIESDFKINKLFATKEFIEKNKQNINKRKNLIERVEQGELQKIGLFEHNVSALAVVSQRPEPKIENFNKDLVIALDNIKDPGNLGTILRIADWYGIKNIVASIGCVDFYNHKTISASMGSFLRVNIIYTDLYNFLTNSKLPKIGATLNGENARDCQFPTEGILLIGSESNGISKELEQILDKKITIKKFGNAESLNASVATAIILDNWKNSNKN